MLVGLRSIDLEVVTILMVLFVSIETELAENIWLVMVGREGGEARGDGAI